MSKGRFNSRMLAACCALTAIALLSAQPVRAQFGQIFGAPPPRPPANVPSRPPAPAPLGLPEQMPPEEMEDDAAPPPPTARAYPPQVAPRTQQPGAVRTQPLAPPPGATATPPGAGPNARLQPGQPMPPSQPGAPPAGQPLPAPPGAQQPANTAPQPGDEIVTEMPSQKIPNPTAVFAGLDKITGRIISFEVGLNEKVQFGALQVTPRVCYTRPPTETANTDSFVEVNEVTLQGEVKRIFSGWMFASSPGLHAVEHPIYDVWLTDCKGGTTVITDAQPNAPAAATASPQQRQPAQRTGAPGNDPTAKAAATPPARQPGQPTLAQPQPNQSQPQQQLPPVPPPNFSAPRR